MSPLYSKYKNEQRLPSGEKNKTGNNHRIHNKYKPQTWSALKKQQCAVTYSTSNMLNLQRPYFSCEDRTTNNTNSLQHGPSATAKGTLGVGCFQCFYAWWRGHESGSERQMMPLSKYLKRRSSRHCFNYKRFSFLVILRFLFIEKGGSVGETIQRSALHRVSSF